MKVAITGAGGFLGWHTRVLFEAVAGHEVVPITRGDWDRLPELISEVDAVIHIAGVNRGTSTEVEEGNIALATDLAAALCASSHLPRVVFANSIHAGAATPYGLGKSKASQLLARVAENRGLPYRDVPLPNLFGEHGRPDYNSFVHTFVKAVIDDRPVQVDDRPIGLLHVQGAAQALLDATASDIDPVFGSSRTVVGVREVFEQLRLFHQLYITGDLPPLTSVFALDLFNTYRAALFPARYPIGLPVRQDHRGHLVEVVRAHGDQGQTFVSTTRPGATRGDHFHLRKIERFVVLRGQARIMLRRLYHDDIVAFDVDGSAPALVDMPTMWTHNITNIGSGELTTLFWTNELFDPARPDTYAHPVQSIAAC